MIDFPEQIHKDIEQVNQVAHDLQMKLYVVGGFPRDIVSGKGITDETDLDVTEGFGNAFDLAYFVSAKYNLADPVVYDASGTALVTMPSGRKVEFHNAFWNIRHIVDQLYVLGVEPTPLNRDVYCRDYTINTLLFDPDTNKILDITGKGISDIKNKILRTPISPAKILSISPQNILRGIRFKLAMNLTEDPEYAREVFNHIPALIEFLKDHPKSKMVLETVKKTLKANSQKAIQEYRNLGIISYLPSNIDMSDAIQKEIFENGTNPSEIMASGNSMVKEAQSKMMQRIIEEREKHKAYMRRKRKEDIEGKKEKFKIMDRARSGYYLHNDEPEFVKNRKIDKNRKIFDYIKQKGPGQNA